MITIYTLTHPTTGMIVYVGSTKMSIAERMYCHTHKFLDGLPAIAEELDSCSIEDRGRTEGYWIFQMKAWGFELLNENKHLSQFNIYSYPRKHTSKMVRLSDKDTNRIRAVTKFAVTLEDRAKVIGVSSETMHRILAGKKIPTQDADCALMGLSVWAGYVSKDRVKSFLKNN